MWRLVGLIFLVSCLEEPNKNDFIPSGDDGMQQGDEVFCTPPNCPPQCTGGYWVSTIEGTIEDEEASAIENAVVVLCVRDLSDHLTCINPVRTNEQGNFVVNVPANTRCMTQAVLRMVAPSTTRSAYYCDVPLSNHALIQLEEPFVLYPTTLASTIPPEGDTSQVRTVVFEDGLELDVVPDSIFTGDGLSHYEEMAAAQVAPEELCFVSDPADLIAVYHFFPEANLSQGFPLRIPNMGLPADSDVTLYLLGGLSCRLADDTLVPEGEWVVFGSAVVSSDGLWIEGDPLPCLGFFGYGPAQ